MTTETTPSPATPEHRSLAQRIRRWVVGTIIVSFGIAALGGIIVLLSGTWSETAAKVLGTTALTGLFSVAVLCGVALVGKRAQWFGWATVGISLLTLVYLLWQLWTEFRWSSDHSFQLTITMCILTAACAVASLLLPLITHDRELVRGLLMATLSFIALGVLLTLLAVWEVWFADAEGYWRITGVAWILAALGTIVLPVVSLLIRANTHAEGAAPTEATYAPRSSALSPDSLDRIAAAAREAGITPDDLVRRLLP